MKIFSMICVLLVVPEKRFPCRCSAGHCEEAYTFCVTSLNGGVCYRGVEGQFCIDAAETARKARLCADGVSCCNTSFCNELGKHSVLPAMHQILSTCMQVSSSCVLATEKFDLHNVYTYKVVDIEEARKVSF